MPKMKTKKAAAKRLKMTASGRLKLHKANHSHILTKKDRKRKRRLRTASRILYNFQVACQANIELRHR
jgi:large subunit ribosomal protein L35